MLKQLKDILEQPPSQDMAPLVDMLFGEANTLVQELHSKVEVCMGFEQFDLVDQIFSSSAEFEELQRRAERWKAAASGAGGQTPIASAASSRSTGAAASAASPAAAGGGTPGSTRRLEEDAELGRRRLEEAIQQQQQQQQQSSSTRSAIAEAQRRQQDDERDEIDRFGTFQSIDERLPPQSDLGGLPAFGSTGSRRSLAPPTPLSRTPSRTPLSRPQEQRRNEARQTLQTTLEGSMREDPTVLQWALSEAQQAGVGDVDASLISEGERALEKVNAVQREQLAQQRLQAALDTSPRNADSLRAAIDEALSAGVAAGRLEPALAALKDVEASQREEQRRDQEQRSSQEAAAERERKEAEDLRVRRLQELRDAAHGGNPDTLSRAIDLARSAGVARVAIKSASANLMAMRFAQGKVSALPVLQAWSAHVAELKASRRALKEALHSGAGAEELEDAVDAASDAGVDETTCDMARTVASHRRSAHDQAAVALASMGVEDLHEAKAMNEAAGGPKSDVGHLMHAIAQAEEDARMVQSWDAGMPDAVDRYFEQIELEQQEAQARVAKALAAKKAQEEAQKVSSTAVSPVAAASPVGQMTPFVSTASVPLVASPAASPVVAAPPAWQKSPFASNASVPLVASPAASPVGAAPPAWQKSPFASNASVPSLMQAANTSDLKELPRTIEDAPKRPATPPISRPEIKPEDEEEWERNYKSMKTRVERARRWFAVQEQQYQNDGLAPTLPASAYDSKELNQRWPQGFPQDDKELRPGRPFTSPISRRRHVCGPGEAEEEERPPPQQLQQELRSGRPFSPVSRRRQVCGPGEAEEEERPSHQQLQQAQELRSGRPFTSPISRRRHVCGPGEAEEEERPPQQLQQAQAPRTLPSRRKQVCGPGGEDEPQQPQAFRTLPPGQPREQSPARALPSRRRRICGSDEPEEFSTAPPRTQALPSTARPPTQAWEETGGQPRSTAAMPIDQTQVWQDARSYLSSVDANIGKTQVWQGARNYNSAVAAPMDNKQDVRRLQNSTAPMPADKTQEWLEPPGYRRSMVATPLEEEPPFVQRNIPMNSQIGRSPPQTARPLVQTARSPRTSATSPAPPERWRLPGGPGLPEPTPQASEPKVQASRNLPSRYKAGQAPAEELGWSTAQTQQPAQAKQSRPVLLGQQQPPPYGIPYSGNAQLYMDQPPPGSEPAPPGGGAAPWGHGGGPALAPMVPGADAAGGGGYNYSNYEDLRGVSTFHSLMANAARIARKPELEPRRSYEDPTFWR